MEHIPSGFSMTTISSFKSIENKHAVNRGEDCMKKFCQSLRKHTVKIIKKIKLLTKKLQQHMKMKKFVVFVKENLKINM